MDSALLRNVMMYRARQHFHNLQRGSLHPLAMLLRLLRSILAHMLTLPTR